MIKQLARPILFATALLVSAFAFAQDAPPAPPPEGGAHGDFAKVREACRADVERYCKDVVPGHGHIRECLRAHEADLSDGCKAALKEAREHHHPRQ
jgi:Cysteine rich repeat